LHYNSKTWTIKASKYLVFEEEKTKRLTKPVRERNTDIRRSTKINNEIKTFVVEYKKDSCATLVML